VTYPLGYPLASSRPPADDSKRGASGSIVPTKDQRSSTRLSARRVSSIGQRLSDRDQSVVQLVDRFRVMSTDQLQRLFWPDGTPQTRGRLARHGLARLCELEVLAPLARRVGGVRAGSKGRIFAVGLAGQRLLTTASSARRARRPHTPGERYLAHTLAVGELYVQLVERQRWGLAQVLEFDAEPACWRTYLGTWGARLTLKPDAYVKLADTVYEYSWLIECDMATESLATIERKARRYLDYHRSGAERRAHGASARVVWIVPDDARAEPVREAVARLPAPAESLFAVTTADVAASVLAGAGS
jgi:hypothetical protein